MNLLYDTNVLNLILSELSVPDLRSLSHSNKSYHAHISKSWPHYIVNKITLNADFSAGIKALIDLGYNGDLMWNLLIINNGDYGAVIKSVNPFNLIHKDLQLVISQLDDPDYLTVYVSLYKYNGDVVATVMKLYDSTKYDITDFIYAADNY